MHSVLCHNVSVLADTNDWNYAIDQYKATGNGAISAGTAEVITLTVGKDFIEVYKANKMGKLNDDEILSSKGLNMMKKEFGDNLKKK